MRPEIIAIIFNEGGKLLSELFRNRPRGSEIENKVVLSLGPRLIMVGKEALGTSDNISIQVAEATEEELEKLKSAYEIRVVKMVGESGKEK